MKLHNLHEANYDEYVSNLIKRASMIKAKLTDNDEESIKWWVDLMDAFAIKPEFRQHCLNFIINDVKYSASNWNTTKLNKAKELLRQHLLGNETAKKELLSLANKIGISRNKINDILTNLEESKINEGISDKILRYISNNAKVPANNKYIATEAIKAIRRYVGKYPENLSDRNVKK